MCWILNRAARRSARACAKLEPEAIVGAPALLSEAETWKLTPERLNPSSTTTAFWGASGAAIAF